MFDHQVITVPNGLSFFSSILDERTIGINLLVEISAGINPETGVVTWQMVGIDPDTGVAPTDPSIGVLPVENSAGDGEGSLVYSIRANANATSGTIVSSHATVTFDTQPPINTNIWANTIDTSRPFTTLTAITPTAPTTQLAVSWTGTDSSGGSGIEGYTVYASSNGGATYSPWLINTQLTSGNYVVVPGQTYSFYVIAYDNAGDSSIVPSQPQATVTIPANTFMAASVFYNNSFFNGFATTASATDDSAIATDKTPLLPGQTATFANYTSYSKGINGIFIDLAGALSSLSASDFAFTVGNSSEVSLWTAAPSPASISIRSIDNGTANRVTLIWADNAIQNEWLSITILANTDTGLTVPTTFYFGNAIGESGNSTANAAVNTSDSLGARGHEATGVPITNAWDYNRDGNVDATDVAIAQQHATSGRAVLQLITPPGGASPSPQAMPLAMIASPDGATATVPTKHAHAKPKHLHAAVTPAHHKHAAATAEVSKPKPVPHLRYKLVGKRSVHSSVPIKHPLEADDMSIVM